MLGGGDGGLEGDEGHGRIWGEWDVFGRSLDLGGRVGVVLGIEGLMSDVVGEIWGGVEVRCRKVG